MEIKLEPVTEDNLQLAVETAVDVFEERDREGIELEFRASAGDTKAVEEAARELRIVNPHYFLATRNGEPVGITGYYNIKDHEEDVWLGWVGVLEKFHRQGIGKELVQQAFARAASHNPKNERIWTTQEEAYDDARRLYRKMGFTEEPYKPHATDPATRLVSVFSRSANPPAQDDSYLWKNSAYYPIDCETFVIPELNQRLAMAKAIHHQPHHHGHKEQPEETALPLYLRQPREGLAPD